MKITITQKTEKELDVTFPIYRKSTSTFMCAIYSPEKAYTVLENKGMEVNTCSLGFLFNCFDIEASKEEFIELLHKAKRNQQQLFTDIVWHESMEQNPAMADTSDMTIKDYSREREEEMNMGVRESDEAERMERNSQDEDDNN